MTETTRQFKQQLPSNMRLNVLSYGLNMGIGLWLVPYLVGHLGKAAYGLIPIAGMMTEYVSLIAQCISGAVARFLTLAIQKGEWAEANRTFNTAFFSYALLAVVQAPIFILILRYANILFDIPAELYADALMLLGCSAIVFFLNLITSVFLVPLYAYNRLDLAATLDITRLVIRTLVIVSLFLVKGPALRYVGIADLIAVSIMCCATVRLGLSMAPQLRLRVADFAVTKVWQLTEMGWWLVVNQIGSLLFLQMDVWICNRFIGAASAGEYAAVLKLANVLRQGGNLFAGIIGPMVMIYYARQEIPELVRLGQSSVRFLCLALAIPLSLMCAFSAPLLTLWLDPSFAALAPLMVLMVGHLIINIGVVPLFAIQPAVNRVRWPGLVTLGAGLINVALAIVFVRVLNWGVYGVAFAGALVLTLKNAVFTPLYGARILGLAWPTFLRSMVPGILFAIGLSLVALAIHQVLCIDSWPMLILVTFTLGLAASGVMWLKILSKEERRLLLETLASRSSAPELP